MSKAVFSKMNGLGNKIIVADMRGRSDRIAPTAAIRLAGDEATSFDQIMAIHDPKTPGTDHYIEIINCDGTQAQACGNGTRCVVQWLSNESGKQDYIFQTLAGILTANEHEDGLITVDMGKPHFGWKEIPLAHEVADTRAINLSAGPVDAPVRMQFSGSKTTSGPMRSINMDRGWSTIRSFRNAPIFPSLK